MPTVKCTSKLAKMIGDRPAVRRAVLPLQEPLQIPAIGGDRVAGELQLRPQEYQELRQKLLAGNLHDTAAGQLAGPWTRSRQHRAGPAGKPGNFSRTGAIALGPPS